MSENLRRRRKKASSKPKSTSKTATVSESGERPQTATRKKQPQQWSSTTWMMLLVAYIFGASFINPLTIPYYFHRLIRPPCQGICEVEAPTTSAPEQCDAPIDTNRLIFMRIPKTASSSIRQLMQKFQRRKQTSAVDLGELEDLVPSIPRPGHGLNLPQGYHDPGLAKDRLRAFYRQASKAVLYPRSEGQIRTFFHGHFYLFDFANHAQRMIPPSPLSKVLPTFMQQAYNVKPPSRDEVASVQLMTMMRRPLDRLASMYYYDRHKTRNEFWRRNFVEDRGNVTLEECLMGGEDDDESCIKANQLERWCSIQTEMICGNACAAKKGKLDAEDLALAKSKLEKDFAFFGIVERMPESVRLLEKVFPTYFEGASTLPEIPRENQANVARREKTYSPESKQVLDRLCRLDKELYEFADSLFSKRLQECDTD